MTSRDKPASDSRIPLVSGAVIAVRSRPYLAYLLALVALGLGGYVWWSAHEDASVLHGDHDRLGALETRMADMRRQQQRQLDDLTLKGRELDELTARMARLDDTLGADQRRAWLLNESDHYLHLAQQHLQLTRDATGARALLDVADRLLAAHGDNRLLPLREAIARDRLSLAAAQAVDVPGLYLRLGALAERVATLQLPVEDSRHAAAAGTATGSAVAPGAGWARLRSLVTVRHHERPLQPLQSDDYRALAREGLRLDLAQVQLGLLRGEPVVYRAGLAAAGRRLAQDFALLPRAEYQGLQKELAELAAVDIQPALPDLGASLRALDALSAREAAAVPAFAAPATGRTNPVAGRTAP